MEKKNSNKIKIIAYPKCEAILEIPHGSLLETFNGTKIDNIESTLVGLIGQIEPSCWKVLTVRPVDINSIEIEEEG